MYRGICVVFSDSMIQTNNSYQLLKTPLNKSVILT